MAGDPLVPALWALPVDWSLGRALVNVSDMGWHADATYLVLVDRFDDHWVVRDSREWSMLSIACFAR